MAASLSRGGCFPSAADRRLLALFAGLNAPRCVTPCRFLFHQTTDGNLVWAALNWRRHIDLTAIHQLFASSRWTSPATSVFEDPIRFFHFIRIRDIAPLHPAVKDTTV